MLAAAWVLSLGCPTVAAQELRTLPPTEMQEDLFRLTEALQSYHAGLLRYATPEEIEEAFGEALLAAEEPRDVLGFYRVVSECLARVRCGHTRASLGEADRNAALAKRGMLPLDVLLTGERAWVVGVLDEGAALAPGQELLSIDGLTIAEVRKRAFARLSDDGFIESGKERVFEAEFAELYALLCDERASPADEHVLTVAGRSEAVRVKGLAPEVFARRRGARPEPPLVRLELRPAEGAAILAVRAFGDPGGGEPSFPEQLEQAFRTLREKQVAHLILDLRGNGGGVDMYGALLVSYLAEEPFGYFERIEVTPEYTGQVKIVEQDGRRLMLSHDGLQVQQPAEQRFEGDVAVLIDGFTFSTAADVATVAHHNRLATFLGEETGGGYDGNTSGDSLRLVLLNSHFTVGVPKWMYTTANVGHAHPGRGVPPDFPLRPAIGDVLAGRDVVLELALERIRTGGAKIK